jgi:methionine aminopeptidase
MLRLLICVAAAAVVGVFAPRRRPAALMIFAALLSVGALFSLVWFSSASIIAGALGASGLLAALLLARALPRLFIFLLLVAALALSGFSPPTLPRAAGLALLIGVLAAAAALASRADLGMRIACALLGGRCLALLLHGDVPLWQRLALAIAVFAAATVIPGRKSEQPPPGPAATVGTGASLSILLGISLLVAWVLAPALPETQGEPFASRLQRLKSEAPRVGLLWALPSEAIFWQEERALPATGGARMRGALEEERALPASPVAEPRRAEHPNDAHSFPAIDNLDAIWLGAPPRILYKMQNTSIFGRLSLHAAAARLREIKDAAEVAQLRLAARAIVEALRENLRLFRPGVREAEIARAILDSARRRGCAPESFPPVVASGASAARPHGAGNEGVLRAGDLTMTDAGCYSAHYASDFTRTVPISGKFTERQRKLYEAVYQAQQDALKACRPGAHLKELDRLAREAIKSRGLEDHNPFGIGHTVGLFVHDVGGRRELAPGMVITIEPGLYLKGELGIRIEDTYLVTEKGCELLSEGFPAEAESVEKLMRQALISAAPQ